MNRKTSRNDATLEGVYANYFAIGHNVFEFVFDFGQYYPEGDQKARLHTRIITSPFYAKTLSEMLQESVEQYEQQHGTIRENGVKASNNHGK